MAAGEAALRDLKRAARLVVKERLEAMGKARVDAESALISSYILESKSWKAAKSVFLYLSMPNEFQTSALLQDCVETRKKVHVPLMVGKHDMRAVHVNPAAIESFPMKKWGIREPEVPEELQTADSVTWSTSTLAKSTPPPPIDLVIMPGVLFDRKGKRLGHGRGYYDKFLSSLKDQYSAAEIPFPTLMAPCLSVQVSHSPVPGDDSDWNVDMLVTPDGIMTPGVVEEERES